MGIMFWLFISCLSLSILSFITMFILILVDANRRKIEYSFIKIFLFWVYFVWDYLWVAKRSSGTIQTEKEQLRNQSDNISLAIRVLYFLTIAFLILTVIAILLHDLG